MPSSDVDDRAAQAALDALLVRIERATEQIAAEGAEDIQRLARAFTPIGDYPDNSTNPPGDLAESISIDGPTQLGLAVYSAEVGPTEVYSRQRELGGHIYPGQTARSIGAVDHPGGTGRQTGAGRLRFTWHGRVVFAAHVYQDPEPYMKPGAAAAEPVIHALAVRKWGDAITGV